MILDQENRKIDNFVRLNPLKVRFKTPKESLDYFPGVGASKTVKMRDSSEAKEDGAWRVVVNDFL